MKLDKSFLTLFVGLAMAACSNDEEMATGGQDLLPVDGREAYMSVSVAMPKVQEHVLRENIMGQRTSRT